MRVRVPHLPPPLKALRQSTRLLTVEVKVRLLVGGQVISSAAERPPDTRMVTSAILVLPTPK